MNGLVSVLERDKEKNKNEELRPMSKEEALASIKQFRQQFGLSGTVSKKHIQGILKKSGLLSDEVTKMRHEEGI